MTATKNLEDRIPAQVKQGRGYGHTGQSSTTRSARARATRRLGIVLVSPTLLVLGLVVVFPFIAGLSGSLFVPGQGLDANGFVIQGEEFVGARNYTDVFTGEAGRRFGNALWNTSYFTVITVTLETVLGMAMALIMHKAFRGRGLVRASILVPWAIPGAVAAIMWRWIFDPNGVANAVLGQEILWSVDGWQAQLAVIIAEVWKTAPFIGLLILAGLQIIPQDVYEAAKIDGAGPLRGFVSITLPLVKPALLVAVLFRLLDALAIFDTPVVLIGMNKPSVQTLSMLAFQEVIDVRYGPAAAYATILFIYVAAVAFVFVKLLGADLIGEPRLQAAGKRKTWSKPRKSVSE